MKTTTITVSFFLRVGLAVVFFYAATASLLAPQDWIGFFPTFLRNLFPAQLLLTTHAVAEYALAFWLLSNKKPFYAALIAAGALLTIIIANITLLDIVFRDVAIFFAAIALAVLTKDN